MHIIFSTPNRIYVCNIQIESINKTGTTQWVRAVVVLAENKFITSINTTRHYTQHVYSIRVTIKHVIHTELELDCKKLDAQYKNRNAVNSIYIYML
jgi:hypothetical protein